jgi:amino acid transporter
MITLNGTLGTGLYWVGGQVLGTGGQVGAILAFFFVGVLSWLVMQCITELLCIWPVPGALSVYVSTFVDEELGVAAGIAYWFTYSVSFSALIASVAQEVTFWKRGTTNIVQGVVMFLLLPVVLTAINWYRIKVIWLRRAPQCFVMIQYLTSRQIYGSIETGVGTFKIAFYVTIAAFMFSIAVG